MSTTSLSKKTYAVHKSFFFRHMTIGVVSTINTHNIAKHLNIEDLETAVYRLVDRNPILSGTLCYGGKNHPGVYVQAFKFDKFVHRVPTPNGIPSPATIKNAIDMGEYVRTYIEPLIPPSRKGKEELNEKLPLFGVHVMQLPDGYVYYAPRFSHVLGDGVTYYNLIHELNAILNDKRLKPRIQWEPEAGLYFDFTHQIYEPLYWFVMIAMIVLFAVTGKPKTQHILLSKRSIEAQKRELTRDGAFLSTNDITTAAICESVASKYAVCNQSVDYRNRYFAVSERDSGNLSRLVPILTKKGKNPNAVRAWVDSLEHGPNLDMPLWESLFRGGYNQTNWACIQQTLDGTIFHSPMQSIVDNNDIPIVIIYQPNEKEIGLIHNLKGLDASSLEKPDSLLSKIKQNVGI